MTALQIIKKIGIFELWDGQGGCPCGKCYIKGITIHCHCWRTRHLECSCRFSGIHLKKDEDCNYSNQELKTIGAEIKKQVEEIWFNTEWEVVIDES